MDQNHRGQRKHPSARGPASENRQSLEVAIFNLNGRFLTVENACPHKGGPLCDGIVTGTAVVCPLHGRHFDLETGMPVRASEPSCLAVFPTRVEDGIILVDVEAGYRLMDETSA